MIRLDFLDDITNIVECIANVSLMSAACDLQQISLATYLHLIQICDCFQLNVYDRLQTL